MATTKVTIRLDARQLEDVRASSPRGQASSVSGFVKHAVGVALHDAAGWQLMLDALQQTGGPLAQLQTHVSIVRSPAWGDVLTFA